MPGSLHIEPRRIERGHAPGGRRFQNRDPFRGLG